jgi:ActR/RegA family two-component response regulator
MLGDGLPQQVDHYPGPGSVSREHLHRYLGEFDYRFTTRKMSDATRMAHMMRRTAGRRLTYRQPTTQESAQGARSRYL